MCLLDASGRVLELDPGFGKLVGLDFPAAALGRPLHTMVLWAPPLAEHNTLARMPAGDEVIELSCRRASSGPVAYVVVARRIAGESDLAARLRVASQTLDSVIEASPLAITTLDANRHVVMWNRAAERMFGWSRDELVGQPYPLVPESERERFAVLFDQVVMNGEGYAGIESVRQRKDGSMIEVRMHTAPLRDADGRATGAMALLEDLTETRALQDRIRHSQKMEAIGRLAGGIAHDFNNLLTVIIGTADLLMLDGGLDTSAHARVNEILQVANSARELIAQLMTFSRRSVVSPRVVDLNERLHDSAKMLERLIGETVRLELELCPGHAWIRLDPSQLDQVLLNLAVNAADAMPRGGTLWYTTNFVEVPPDRAAPLRGGRHVCLEVRDTGTGIAPEHLPHVFDPFFTTKAVGEGTGLGLANVYGIIRQAGGDIEVESTVGRGTCFRLYLPYERAPSTRAPSGPHQSGLPRGHERVLLVEDNVAVRKSAAKLLAALGYQVETAADGVDALETIDSGAGVDLVLTDLSMPRMGGAELANRLRERAPQLPVLFMSGNLEEAELREQIERGHARFLQKPVRLRDLAWATRELLDADD